MRVIGLLTLSMLFIVAACLVPVGIANLAKVQPWLVADSGVGAIMLGLILVSVMFFFAFALIGAIGE